MHPMTPVLLVLALLITTPFAPKAAAEQYETFGDVKVHYIVLNSAFLEPEIAANYRIVRAKDRALVNISLIGADGESLEADVTGSTTNLLGQRKRLDFRRVEEGTARYYLATFKYTNRDTLGFSIGITRAGSRLGTLQFQQKMYWEKE